MITNCIEGCNCCNVCIFMSLFLLSVFPGEFTHSVSGVEYQNMLYVQEFTKRARLKSEMVRDRSEPFISYLHLSSTTIDSRLWMQRSNGVTERLLDGKFWFQWNLFCNWTTYPLGLHKAFKDEPFCKPFYDYARIRVHVMSEVQLFPRAMFLANIWIALSSTAVRLYRCIHDAKPTGPVCDT